MKDAVKTGDVNSMTSLLAEGWKAAFLDEVMLTTMHCVLTNSVHLGLILCAHTVLRLAS